MGFIYFLLGTILGSFLNAVFYRLPRQMSARWERSICPNCGHVLNWYDLIPIVSFVWLRGKCRYCHSRISFIYPAVELAMGGLLWLVWYVFVQRKQIIQPVPANLSEIIFLLGVVFLLWVLVFIFLYDFKYYLILDKIVIPAILVAFIWQLSQDFSLDNLVKVTLGAVVGGGFFAAQFIISKGRWIGGGDIRLGALLGAMLGWPLVVLALVLAYFLGSAVAIGLLVSGKKKWGSQIPFGTFLAVAAIITLFFGYDIWQWYWSLSF